MRASLVAKLSTGRTTLASSSRSVVKYGRYDVLSAPGKTTSIPLAVPASITRPSYVPVNFFTREEGELLEMEEEDDEGYHGEVGDAALEKLKQAGRIKLGSEDEKAVRQAARHAAEILKAAGSLVTVRLSLASRQLLTLGPARDDDR
jgi:hypothetical protein